MRIIILFISLLFSQLAIGQNKGWWLSGDTLRYINGDGDTVQINKLVPSMVGNSGKVLSNNGTNYTWITNTPSVSWGGITGTLSEQTDLQAALSGKQATINTGTSSQYFKGDLSLGTYLGHTINVQALTSSPADGATVYFGMLPKAPTTTANISKVYLREAGTITGAEIYCYSGTAGTNESWSLYIRKNNTTDYLIATVAASTSERVFSNTNLSISMAAGDYFEIKGVQPTWATNPATTIYGGYIKIK